MTDLERMIADALRDLIAKAETGEQWAEICRLEQEMMESNNADLGNLQSRLRDRGR